MKSVTLGFTFVFSECSTLFFLLEERNRTDGVFLGNLFSYHKRGIARELSQNIVQVMSIKSFVYSFLRRCQTKTFSLDEEGAAPTQFSNQLRAEERRLRVYNNSQRGAQITKAVALRNLSSSPSELPASEMTRHSDIAQHSISLHDYD